MLLIRKPWDSQPQEVAQVDWENPLAQDLAFAFNASSPNVDLVSGGMGVDGPGGTTAGVSLGGRHLSGNNALGAYRGWTTVRGNTQYTAAAVVIDSLGRGADRNPIDADHFTGGNRNFQLRFNSSNQAQFIAFNTAVANVSAASTATSSATDISVIVGTLDSAKVARVYLNGALGGTSSALGGTPAAIDLGERLAVAGWANNDTLTQPFRGPVYCAFYWRRALSAGEIQELSRNPWQLFAPRSIWVPVSAGVGSVSGTSATTNANDTSTASGTTTVVGTSATTNAADTSAASGSVGGAVTGTSATTNADDAGAASGTTTVTGTVAYSNANDTSTAAGWAGAISGTAAVTNADDASSAAGSAGSVQAFSGGWFPPIRRRTKKEIDDERRRLGILPPEVVEEVAAVPVARRRITLQDLIGKKAAAEITNVDLSAAIAASKRRKRQRDDELLLLM